MEKVISLFFLLVFLFIVGLFLIGYGLISRQKDIFIVGLFDCYFPILSIYWILAAPSPYEEKPDERGRMIGTIIVAFLFGLVFYGIAKLGFYFVFK